MPAMPPPTITTSGELSAIVRRCCQSRVERSNAAVPEPTIVGILRPRRATTMIGRRRFLSAAASAFVMSGLPAMVRAQSVKPGDSDVLAIVDVQNCFLPGGTLPVPGGDQIIPLINRLAPLFRNVVMTQDWHTPAHASFASSHPGKKAFETIQLPYGTQVLWPDHCIQATPDAELAKD